MYVYARDCSCLSLALADSAANAGYAIQNWWSSPIHLHKKQKAAENGIVPLLLAMYLQPLSPGVVPQEGP